MKDILPIILQELTKLNNNLKPQHNDQFKHYSIDEVAEIMDCHTNTVRTWIKDGELKTFQYKGLMRVRSQSLDRFVMKHSV